MEIIYTFCEIFRLALVTLKAPFMGIINNNKKITNNVDNNDNGKSKVTSFSIRKRSKVKEYKPSLGEKFERKLKDILGITQKEVEKQEEERRKLQEELIKEGGARHLKPRIYKYKVKDRNGRFINGQFSALSKMDVNSYLLGEGYEVYKIEDSNVNEFIHGKSSLSILNSFNKWSNKDLVFWLTQLSTYIKSGIPLTDSIKILINQYNNDKRKKETMQAVAYELTMGNSFSNALEKQGDKFDPLLINMLKAAEATGELEETLEDMSNYYKEVETTRKEMINALTYPVMIFTFAIAVVIFIILYVVPQFSDIYTANNIEIKGLAKMVLILSDFLKHNIFTLLLGVFGTIITLVICYSEIKQFRRIVQEILMSIPVIKNIIIYNEIAIFTKTFASLLKNNVLITDSVEILSNITSNEVYKEIMYDTISHITVGDKISSAFKDHWAVPDVAYYMIQTGESTGELAKMLDQVSHFYQEQHRSIVSTLKTFIEPITIIFLAVIVGGIIISVIVPMFDMYSEISSF